MNRLEDTHGPSSSRCCCCSAAWQSHASEAGGSRCRGGAAGGTDALDRATVRRRGQGPTVMVLQPDQWSPKPTRTEYVPGTSPAGFSVPANWKSKTYRLLAPAGK